MRSHYRLRISLVSSLEIHPTSLFYLPSMFNTHGCMAVLLLPFGSNSVKSTVCEACAISLVLR